jgi:hypothetical protein
MLHHSEGEILQHGVKDMARFGPLATGRHLQWIRTGMGSDLMFSMALNGLRPEFCLVCCYYVMDVGPRFFARMNGILTLLWASEHSVANR